ncbi:hypothetical protein ACFSQP_13030 [Bizionia sediminis]|uniref:Uncharacterized protein n=1 Tax=Bizionia sediminis TaxID=1737064 RepID=A0ABW5KYP8_9FLAO
MLPTIYSDFCNEVKEMSLGIEGNNQLYITCDKSHPKSILTSPSIKHYSTVVDILKKIYGSNYNDKEEYYSEQYKDCDEIYLHFVKL